MDRVHEQVYIADITDVRETSLPPDVDIVVTVCQDTVESNVSCTYQHFNMADGPHADEFGDGTYTLFRRAATYVLGQLRGGQTLLIHCHAGISRSPATSIAALAVYEDTDFHEMRKRVERQRPQIQPDMSLIDKGIRFVEEHR